jgi:hypothetical protein
MDEFTKGFTTAGENQVELSYLVETKETEKHFTQFKYAEHVILAFPLYTDAMPSIVKAFIEALEPLCGEKNNPSLGFVVQSGFPEPYHSRYVEKYLEKLAARLGCRYQGIAVRGGVEGIKVMPGWITRKVFKLFYELGFKYSKEEGFDSKTLEKLAPWERLSKKRILFVKLMGNLGMIDYFWNRKLKKNKVFDKRFAKPYED